MKLLFFIYIVLLVGVPTTFVIASNSIRYVAAASRPMRPVMVVGAMLATSGAAGFFGTMLPMLGVFDWMPATTPWPIGIVERVVSTDEGDHVVAHSVGRIQVYDPKWRYKTGWFINSRSQPYKITSMDLQGVEVATSSANTRCRYDWNGDVMSQSHIDDYEALAGIEEWRLVSPTWVLLPISSPWMGFACLVLGLIVLEISNSSHVRMGGADRRRADRVN